MCQGVRVHSITYAPEGVSFIQLMPHRIINLDQKHERCNKVKRKIPVFNLKKIFFFCFLPVQSFVEEVMKSPINQMKQNTYFLRETRNHHT